MARAIECISRGWQLNFSFYIPVDVNLYPKARAIEVLSLTA
jgi:hypothetical protein